jgi:hypothetical protein
MLWPFSFAEFVSELNCRSISMKSPCLVSELNYSSISMKSTSCQTCQNWPTSLLYSSTALTARPGWSQHLNPNFLKNIL